MSMRITRIEGFKFKTEYRGFEVISDVPIPTDHEPEGMSPGALMMAALGTCARAKPRRLDAYIEMAKARRITPE